MFTSTQEELNVTTKRDELRALLMLKALYEFHQREGRVARQADLVPPGDPLLDREWERLGLKQDVSAFGIHHAVTLTEAVKRLRDCGLMVAPPRRKKGRSRRTPQPYELTPKGGEVAATLGDDWHAWPSLDEVCP